MDIICLPDRSRPEPWNKGKLIGQKPPFKAKEVWSIRIRLQIADHKRDLALFNLAIDSKLRGCDLVRLRVYDLWIGGEIRHRAKLVQSKTGAPVKFEVTQQTREALEAWRRFKGLSPQDWLFPSRKDPAGISARGSTAASSTAGSA